MNDNRKGSVLLLTLFLIVLAAFAMSRFIEKAYGEILSEAVHSERDRLRMEAYSALESTVAIMYQVQQIAGALHAPSQGWGDPLWLAGVELSPGINVQIEFVDEMGKISLPAANRERMLRLFDRLGFDSIEGEELTDSLMGWMSQESALSSFSSHHLDYERAELPYRPPYRTLRSFYELAAVAGFKEAFFDSQGVPNERFHRFTSMVSLYRFDAINVNSVSPDVLHVWSGIGEAEADNIGYNRGQVTSDLPYFQNIAEAEAQLGVPLGNGYGVATHAVRVNVTVTEGTSRFVVSAVVAPSGQAEALRPAAAGTPNQGATAERGRRGQQRGRQATQRTPEPAAGATGQAAVPYPYTFLDLRENETIL